MHGFSPIGTPPAATQPSELGAATTARPAAARRAQARAASDGGQVAPSAAPFALRAPADLQSPPPLPPSAKEACARAGSDPAVQETFLVLAQESQSALTRACGITGAAPVRDVHLTPSQRLLASLGDVAQMDDGRMTCAFLLLSAQGNVASRRALELLSRTLEDGAQRGLALQREERARVHEAAAQLSARQQALSWAVPAGEAVGAACTLLVVSVAGPVGIALAGLGAAVGAAGGVGWHRHREPEDGLAGAARAAARGALLGASCATLASGPLMGWLCGTAPATGAAAVLGGDAVEKGFTLLVRCTRAGIDMGLGTAQFWQAKSLQNVRNTEALLRVSSLHTSVVQQLQERSYDAVTQLVRAREQSVNQVARLLSRRSQVTLRIQAQIRH